MRREVPPSKVSSFTAFPPLPQPYSGVNIAGKTTFGHVSKDGLWAWVARDSVLEVFSTRTQERCSSWCFGAILKNTTFTISAITELCSTSVNYPCLLVGVDTQCDGSLLCMFNVKTSKVVKVIKLPYKITSLEVVSGEGGASIETSQLNSILRCMFGLIAVGTECGHVYFMDLCLDAENYSDEIVPNKVVFVTKAIGNIPERRKECLSYGNHLCLSLNDGSVSYDVFQYQTYNTVLASYPSDEVHVSTLKYVSSLAALTVGFNFGGVQIWNLQKLNIQQTFPIRSKKLPVVQFTFQEPENDPREFCYLWAITGFYQGENFRPSSVSVASLYSLTYSTKTWLNGFGYLYQGLVGCSRRFEYVLSNDPFSYPPAKSVCSRLITCHVVPPTDSLYRPDADDSLQAEELNISEDLSTCVMAWEVWPNVGDSPSSCYLVFFDINQWYQAQMPSTLRYNSGEFCSYLGVFSLQVVTSKINSESLLDIYVVPRTLTKFKCLTVAEEFFYPSSLSFRTWCISVGGSIHASYLGTQKQLLSEMNRAGPKCLIDPKELYNCCVVSGLLSHIQETLPVKHITVVSQREALLTLALEQNMCYFLHSCILKWSSGEFVHVGCTVKFLLEWAWKRVTQIKAAYDKLSQPLFSCSGQGIDKRTIESLISYENQLKRLTNVMISFQTVSGPKTEQGKRELALRIEVVQSVALYMRVVMWLYDSHLLPEHPEGEEYREDEVAYPVSRLSRTYSCHRLELQKLHDSIAATDILLVDGLVAEMGSDLTKLWEAKGGSGIYPPPNLYAAVGSYLLDGVSPIGKHLLLYYVILDMVAFLSDSHTHLVDKLTKFPQAFKISPSLTKLIQAFWLLDHQDFEAAINTLLDPMVQSEDIAPWCHTRILKSFLYQGHQQKALQYIALRKPPQSNVEDIKMHLSILLANSSIYEAFHFQRQHQSEANIDDLLNHLFHSCQQIHSLDALLQFPLNSMENTALVEFLRSCSEPRAQELLVMYYLLNCYPLEAAHLNEKLISELMEHSSKSQEHAKIRNALVTGFLSTLPEEQKVLAQEIQQTTAAQTNNVEAKLEPLSVVITSHSSTLESYSCQLRNALTKLNSISSISAAAPQTPFKPRSVSRASTPFWGTPVVPESSRKSRTPSVVTFATPVVKRPISRVTEASESTSPSKRARFTENMSFRNVDTERRRSMSHLNADVLSLLQTPPIFRKPPQLRSSFGKDGLSDITPHSILKMRRSVSPLGRDIPSVKLPSASSKESETSEDEAVICDDKIVEKKSSPSGSDDSQAKHLRFQVSTSPCPSPESAWLRKKSMPVMSRDYQSNGSYLSFPVERSYKASPRRPLRDLDLSGSSTSSDVYVIAKESLSSSIISSPEDRNDHSTHFTANINENSMSGNAHSIDEPLSLGNIVPNSSNLETVLSSDVFINKNNLEMTPSTSDEKLFPEEIEVDDVNGPDIGIAVQYDGFKENDSHPPEISLTPEITPPSSPIREDCGENFTLQLSDTDQESNSAFKNSEDKASPLKTSAPFHEVNSKNSYAKQVIGEKTYQVQAEVHADYASEEEFYVISEQSEPVAESILLHANHETRNSDTDVVIMEENNELLLDEKQSGSVWAEVKQPMNNSHVYIKPVSCSVITEEEISHAEKDSLQNDIVFVGESCCSVVVEGEVGVDKGTGDVHDESKLLGSSETCDSDFEENSHLQKDVESTSREKTKSNRNSLYVLTCATVPPPLMQDDRELEKAPNVIVEEEAEEMEDSCIVLEPSSLPKGVLEHSSEDVVMDSCIPVEKRSEEVHDEEINIDVRDESIHLHTAHDVKHGASTPEISTPVKTADSAIERETESLPSPIESCTAGRIFPISSHRNMRSQSKSECPSTTATKPHSMCEVLPPKQLHEEAFSKVRTQEKKTKSSTLLGSEVRASSGLSKTKGSHAISVKSKKSVSAEKSDPGDQNVPDVNQTERTPIASAAVRRKAVKQGKKLGRSTNQLGLEYSFSDPNVSQDPGILEALTSPPATPMPSFVFSPPLTRGRMRQKKLNDTVNSSYMSAVSELSFTTRNKKIPEDPLLLDSSSLMPEDSIISAASEKTPSHSAKKGVSKKKRSSMHPALPEISQSIVNLLSPLEAEPSSSVRNSRRQTSSRHSMVLRKGKVKRKSVKLW